MSRLRKKRDSNKNVVKVVPEWSLKLAKLAIVRSALYIFTLVIVAAQTKHRKDFSKARIEQLGNTTFHPNLFE